MGEGREVGGGRQGEKVNGRQRVGCLKDYLEKVRDREVREKEGILGGRRVGGVELPAPPQGNEHSIFYQFDYRMAYAYNGL